MWMTHQPESFQTTARQAYKQDCTLNCLLSGAVADKLLYFLSEAC